MLGSPHDERTTQRHVEPSRGPVRDDTSVTAIRREGGSRRSLHQTDLPVNGLRHPPVADTCGWYLWTGEEFSDEADFFQPLHVEHLVDRLPAALPYLGLPPGWRFLLAPGYADVWFDPSLLDLSHNPDI